MIQPAPVSGLFSELSRSGLGSTLNSTAIGSDVGEHLTITASPDGVLDRIRMVKSNLNTNLSNHVTVRC